MIRKKQPLLQLKNINKSFGDNSVIKNMSLKINKGELLTFIGPSGCGKTTLLRIIGGFHDQDSGQVFLDGESIDHLPPEKRETGMVFQNYALFPHMSIYDNVAYGLNVKKLSTLEKNRLVKEVLEQVQLTGYEERRPSELSGGQQQRVAIARCLVLKPKVLLLDEPLSNLDANLRMHMRDEIRHLKEELNLTIIFVTHDQEEALSISDRVLVMNDGQLQQISSPSTIYQRPINEFVAKFVGHANLLEGKVISQAEGVYFDTKDFRFPIDSSFSQYNEEMQLLIRPEMVKLDRDSDLIGVVKHSVYNGNYVQYHLKVGNQSLLVDDYNIKENELLSRGSNIGLTLPTKPHIIGHELVKNKKKLQFV